MNPIYRFDQAEPPRITEAQLRLILEQRRLRRQIRIIQICAFVALLALIALAVLVGMIQPILSALPFLLAVYSVAGYALIYWVFARYGEALLPCRN